VAAKMNELIEGLNEVEVIADNFFRFAGLGALSKKPLKATITIYIYFYRELP